MDFLLIPPNNRNLSASCQKTASQCDRFEAEIFQGRTQFGTKKRTFAIKPPALYVDIFRLLVFRQIS
ncbi:hypothetical protein DYE49_11920 [Treponema rectale]|uniref:Uncharacterized protein n=1 Tax=Treponema rectale TaxID=744512 RepID=A0A7M1XPX1_9SPIR|nr:hypothetical protein DYE49_11920 [Treponema rectale]